MTAKTLFLLCLWAPLLVFGLATPDNNESHMKHETADGQGFRLDYDYYEEAEGWLKLHQIPANWRDARLMCAREGSVIASPESENLVFSIRTVLKNLLAPSKIFTGVSATYAKGHYFSMEGFPLARMPLSWATGEPDNAGNAEDCLLMLPEGKVADGDCSLLLPYVCYKRQTPSMAVTTCGTVDNDYELNQRTNSCYKFHSERQTWSNAFAACSGEGGHLAIINSEIEAQVLKELCAKAKHNDSIMFIGFKDTGDSELWMTIHGQTLKDAGYDKWNPGQPDKRDDHCGAMIGKSGLLDDRDCEGPLPFICEKHRESLLKSVKNPKIQTPP